MLNIRPFRGLRFNPLHIPNLSEVISPPYDKITSEYQEELYRKHPHNTVRLILGKQFSEDSEADNRYTRSAKDWREWREKKILAQDPRPALYIYDEVFKGPKGEKLTRRGLVAAVELQDYSEGGVKPHEKTLSGPKVDRLSLMRTTHSNFGQVFGLYPDSEGIIKRILERALASRPHPDASAQDDFGVEHRLWVMDNGDIHRQIAQVLREESLTIADGHHRYETALAYRAERRHGNPAAGLDQPYDYLMMTLVAIEDPGLVIYPTHRVLVNWKLDPAAYEEAVRGFYDFETATSFEAVKGLLEKGPAGSIALTLPGPRFYLLSPRKEVQEFLARRFKDTSPAYRSLDLVGLHKLLLEELADLTEGLVTAGGHLQYVKEDSEAVRMIGEGRGVAAFLVRPTRMDQVRAVTQAGETMPQKSTDFQPKIFSGMVFRSLETSDF